MNLKYLPLLVIGLLGWPVYGAAGDNTVSASTGGVTLQQCYDRARQISETLGISNENIRLAEAQIHADRGAILPHIDWIKTQEFQDQTNNPTINNNGSNTSARSPIPLSYFQLTQPLFAGLRDWRALDIAKSIKQQSELNLAQANLQLLSDVATAFYNALSQADQIAVLLDTQKTTANRIQQLNHWVDLGRSRQSEVLTEETQLATTEAQIEELKRSLADARQLLYYLTEVPIDTPLRDDQPDVAPVSNDEALERAGKRPDLMSSVEALHQADLNISYAKGAYWPTLGFVGNSYTERTGLLSDVRWDATFTLDVPLFEGGSNVAGVQEARSQQIISQLTLGQLKRNVQRQVLTDNESLTHSVSEVAAYDKAVDLAMRNYKVQEQEYKLGLISNLDLLQILRDMQTTRSQAVIAHASSKLSGVLLRVDMGEGL